jgi:hypothetical protein
VIGPDSHLEDEPLGEWHRLDAFSCGKGELDQWLRGHSRTAAASHTARTFVWHDGDYAVLAYYSLAMHAVRKETLPKKLSSGALDPLPAVLIGKLALDESMQDQGAGGELLANALQRVLMAEALCAARVVVVDAIDDEAASFYKHFEFRECNLPGRLVYKMSDVEADFSL